MTETTQISANQEYFIAKCFGCYEQKTKLQKLNLIAGNYLYINKITNNKVVAKVKSYKKPVTFPLSFLSQISLVPTNVENFQDIAKSKQNEINISIIQTAESFPTELFHKQLAYQTETHKFNICYLPQVDYIFGNDYPNKRFRNLIFSEKTDLYVAVIDFHKLETELLPIVQLMDLGVKIVILLRGYSPDNEEYGKCNIEMLSNYLGMPIATYNEADESGESRAATINTIISAYNDKQAKSHFAHVNYGRQVEKHIASIEKKLQQEDGFDFNASARFMAICLLEDDTIVQSFNTPCKVCKNPVNCFAKQHKNLLGKQFNNHIFYILKQARRAYIDGLISKITNEKKMQWDAVKKDNILLHSVLGFPFFLIFMLAVFAVSISVGHFTMPFINSQADNLIQLTSELLPSGFFNEVVATGLINALACIFTFLPSILIFYLLVGILESSGYLQRVAFVNDKRLRKFGLQAQTLLPAILGFGCSIPAILASRNIENKADRITASLIVPFLPCIAKMPIFIIIASFIAGKFAFLVVFAVYLVSILLAIVFAKIYSKTVIKQKQFPNVVELTPYRRPTLLMLITKMWSSSWLFVKRSSGFILIGTLLVASLHYFDDNKLTASDNTKSENSEISLYAKFAKAVQPVFEPLGFNNELSVSCTLGLISKELAFYTLVDLQDQNAKIPVGARFAFLVFILICFPCFGALSAIRKVSGFKWAGLSFAVSASFAWLLAFAVNKIIMLL